MTTKAAVGEIQWYLGAGWPFRAQQDRQISARNDGEVKKMIIGVGNSKLPWMHAVRIGVSRALEGLMSVFRALASPFATLGQALAGCTVGTLSERYSIASCVRWADLRTVGGTELCGVFQTEKVPRRY
jgi:hypothetical protein